MANHNKLRQQAENYKARGKKTTTKQQKTKQKTEAYKTWWQTHDYMQQIRRLISVSVLTTRGCCLSLTGPLSSHTVAVNNIGGTFAYGLAYRLLKETKYGTLIVCWAKVDLISWNCCFVKGEKQQHLPT